MTAATVALVGYHILERLYAGTRTLIYRAYKEADQTPVVIKLLRNEYPSFTELAQFRNQFAIAQSLDIPEVIQTYSLEPYKNGYALIMEDFGGISLDHELKQWEAHGLGGSPDGLMLFLNIAIQIAAGLHGLYRHHVIHKDIKPANILIHPTTKRIKLIDFSIASNLPREVQSPATSTVLEGTLAYLSPEQTGRMNRGVDYRADFYSLGITFYQLLTGRLPFQTPDSMELVHCHLAMQPTPIQTLNPAVPSMLAAIADKLMAKNAEDRYQSALGLKHDLEYCRQQLNDLGDIPPFELGRRDICDRLTISEKLYGRESEIATLLNAYERVAQGSSELLLIAGFSGIGKTAIVNEVHKPIAQGSSLQHKQQRSYFIKGKFDQFQRDIPFSAIVQALRTLIEQLLKEDKLHINRWKTKILEAIGDNAQVMLDLIPELEWLIGSQPPALELDAIAAQHRLNWVFQQFVQVFPRAAHPLVMFLDDLQWADSASLKLLQALMSDGHNHHLLVLGAYRDNEVSPVHPLRLTLNEIQAAQATVNTITLSPLSATDLNHLIADTLHAAPEQTQPLARFIFTQTKGNPFFSSQCLKTFYDSGCITFNVETGTWEWELDQIRALSLTEDVVEFMATQIQKLPDATQETLKLAACIGNQFDLKTLAVVYGKSLWVTAADLWQALQAGLILPNSDAYKFFYHSGQGELEVEQEFLAMSLENPSLTYKFLHDRVQQAAYCLIPTAQKAATHLAIGQQLLVSTAPEEREDILFELVNHLNYGVELITASRERNELAQLNLRAARKAIATTAYVIAVDYATTGIQLLKSNSWQRQYELTLALYEAAIEATCLCGQFERMTQLIEVALPQVSRLLDRAKIYEIKIQAYTSQNKLLEALAIAREVLAQFDVSFPEVPTEADIQQAFQTTAAHLADKAVEDLLNLPTMVSAHQLAIMRLTASAIPPAFIAAPNLLPLIILLQVNLSVQHGNTPLSSFSYANYSLLLSSILNDVEAANLFGKLAFNLVARFDSKEIKARTYYVLSAFVIHRSAHVRETLPLLLDSYQTALETGNLEFVGYCAKEICQHSYLIGQELRALEHEMEAYSHALENLKQSTSLAYCQIYWQATLNLLGQADDVGVLSGSAMNEQRLLASLLQANDISGLHYFYLHKLILCYVFGQMAPALELRLKAREYLAGGTGFITVPTFYFYDSLVLLGNTAHPMAPADAQQVEANQLILQAWVQSAPMNYLHKYYLVEAERHRISGDMLTAMELYDRAIALAKEQEYRNEEALACELAAKFYLQWGRDTIAQAYMLNAYHAYQQWGATAKLTQLEQTHPSLLTALSCLTMVRGNSDPAPGAVPSLSRILSTSSAETTNGSGSSISETLDLTTVLKASQALSGEIQLEKLLATLMQVVIENAGAQTGALILCQDGELLIQAQAVRAQPTQPTMQIASLQALPLQGCDTLPITLINYVSRTFKTLVIDDAASEMAFADDPYILEFQPKSVLCTTIRNQGKLIGVLYLENNLTKAAFTRDRLRILKVLTTQAAISLENALLYNSLAAANERLEDYNTTLEQRVAERTQALQQKTHHLEQALQELQRTQTQLIQAEKMSSLGQLVAGVAHEINNPVNFIHGNLAHTNSYVQDLLNLIELYQHEYPYPNAKIQAEIENIDMDFLLEDLPKLLNSMKVGSDRIREIVAGLRNFSRLDEAEMKPVNIHEGIDSALMILQHRLKAKPDSPAIEIIREYSSLPPIECYAGQLNQVFMNIISNAIDALEDVRSTQKAAQRSPHIRIATQRLDDQWVQIRIADNGVGMPQEVQQKIFDPFFTTKPIGSGTGLGLSITYQIVVEKHQGRLSCSSTPGVGTEFRIEVPMQRS